MVTDLHNGASCQVKTLRVLPSKNVPDPLADSQETMDPPTVESPALRLQFKPYIYNWQLERLLNTNVGGNQHLGCDN